MGGRSPKSRHNAIMREGMCQKFEKLLTLLFKKVRHSELVDKLQAVWVFLIFFSLPIFLFSGLSKSPIDKHVALHKEKIIEHRKDWDKYLNHKRVAASGQQKVEEFSEKVLEPIALGLEKSYVDALTPAPEKKNVEEESDF